MGFAQPCTNGPQTSSPTLQSGLSYCLCPLDFLSTEATKCSPEAVPSPTRPAGVAGLQNTKKSHPVPTGKLGMPPCKPRPLCYSAPVFPPYELLNQQEGKVLDRVQLDADDKSVGPVYLKHCTWVDSAGLTKPAISARQEVQITRLRDIKNLDKALQVEVDFLNERSLQEAVKRLKEQSDTHLDRAEMCRRAQVCPLHGCLWGLYSPSAAAAKGLALL